MAGGDLTATGIYSGAVGGDMETAIDGANLAAATDTIHIVPIQGRDQQVKVYKIEREAD